MNMSNNKVRRARRSLSRSHSDTPLPHLPVHIDIEFDQHALAHLQDLEADVADTQATTPFDQDTGADIADDMYQTENDVSPTIVLNQKQLLTLHDADDANATYPPTYPPPDEYYPMPPFASKSTPVISEPPTIILDVATLMAMSNEADQSPTSTFSKLHIVSRKEQSQTSASFDFPHDAQSQIGQYDERPLRRTAHVQDPQHDFATLRGQRLAKEEGRLERLPDEPFVTDKLRQWWQDIQPGINRVLGRAHRGGLRGLRLATTQSTGALPQVSLSGIHEVAQATPRDPGTLQAIGKRAQSAASPALKKLHDRAEHMAQHLVDALDERLGAPPMQQVLLGPGRMIVTFAPHVSIRIAQTIITSVQARSLRCLVGYNAYLIMIPPGREAVFAERLHVYREVTGIHFGPQRPPPGMMRQLHTGR